MTTITMTKAEALEKQAEQIAWYSKIWPDLPVAELVAAATDASKLDDNTAYPVHVINRHIPRGASIEFLCGRYQNNHD